MTVTISFDELRGAAGRDLGYSDWMVVDQSRIDTFADAIEDHQWIHLDPVRAKDTPFGQTIAHGYLTLAAAGTRLGELLKVDGASSIINYGLDRVRFPAPVLSGSRIRTHATITEVSEVPRGLQVAARVTAEVEGGDRPVCVADVHIRYLR
ncbi:MaoC family dehydratase [Streptosporangium sp. NBC_01755]|uniref:MaoC family dehydratase n=1 Tax=unclassified Streptosporangium TaxID=2632669 RepID=UPI002DD853C4|nr:MULTISPECIES: MaoC family dehydratase [unclassified Streptosporangium]WSA24609.1 MaoC family dehydratase [Streptosporangium sp. NBC_01810]WSC97315.1 MaoC family dehydratase [Streptosporangium sp. NBC_01755]